MMRESCLCAIPHFWSPNKLLSDRLQLCERLAWSPASILLLFLCFQGYPHGGGLRKSDCTQVFWTAFTARRSQGSKAYFSELIFLRKWSRVLVLTLNVILQKPLCRMRGCVSSTSVIPALYKSNSIYHPNTGTNCQSYSAFANLTHTKILKPKSCWANKVFEIKDWNEKGKDILTRFIRGALGFHFWRV